MKEQYERFCKVAYTVGHCDRCPIMEECFDYSEQLTPEEQKTAPCCEELIFRYIITGEKPKIGG